ncbi:putative hydro-lyase [Dasania marina]|uniref:putative hydro-lyase n=1 Tax=Dasania marina TaxID=471499 RepID=UPI00035DBD33|nr:putative hydro-lyase [Dasania marina]|tara:strand:+ start:91992 stop:92780 length:789 start_codon:yes stop_codon:yes gene_type:complete
MSADLTPYALRQKIRSGEHSSNTSGLCTGFVQANVVILPKDWAQDFLMFAQANPKPCPIIAVAPEAGAYHLPEAGKDFDIRSDVPQYRIWNDGVMTDEVTDIKDYWRDDLVTFLIGCSFSFEEALIADGLEIRNIAEGVNVPMYRTNVPCKPGGRFSGNTVVSMRPFKPVDAIRMIQICSRFPSVHGAPIHFGDPAAIGIADINKTDFGDPVTIKPGEVPVFTACGVTPQEAIAQAKPPFCITHSPGCMVVTDMPNSKLAIM